MKTINIHTFAIFSLFVAACDPQLPSGAVPISEVPEAMMAYDYVVESWVSEAHRGSDRPVCDSRHLYVVTMNPEELYDYTGYYDTRNTPNCIETYGKEQCAIGFRMPVRGRDSVIILTEGLTPQEISHVYMHEMIHFLADCSNEERDADNNHSEVDFWGEYGVFDYAVRNCRADQAFDDSIVCP